MNKHLIAYIMAFVTIIIWSSTFVVSKVLLESVTPIQLLIVRYFIVVVFLSVIYPKFNKITWRDEWVYIVSGIFLSSYFIFENNALGQTFASNVSLIIATIPLQTQILKSLIYRRLYFTKTGVLGVVLSYIGVVLIVVSGDGVEGVRVLGDVLAFFAAFSFAFYSIYLERTSQSIHIIEKTRKIFAYGLIVLLVYFLAVRGYRSFDIPSISVALGMLYLGVIASGLAFILWNQAVKSIGAIRTNVFTYLVPVFTMIFSFIFINEPITFARIIGGIIILLGIYITEKNPSNINKV